MRLVVTGLALLTVVGVALWPRDADPRPRDPCGAVGAAGRATVCLVNRERAERRLPPLRENPLLAEASLQHSRDMVERRYFEHSTPEGRTVGDRLRAVGYAQGRSASAGENIAWGRGREATPEQIVRAWMLSPGHKADILRPAFTEIGIGIAIGVPLERSGAAGSDGATYTTDFGGVMDPSLPAG
jgi:uncharacterized protein YkwD